MIKVLSSDKDSPMLHNISIGVFIHNEERHIGTFLQDLAKQSVFQSENTNVKVFLLCNGCTDSSVEISGKFAEENGYSLLEWSEGGKSRTWNRFVHDTISRSKQTVVFIDGDLRLPDSRAIARLVKTLKTESSPIVTSKPVKNVSIYTRWNPLRFVASVLKVPHQDGAICGQLYAVKSDYAQTIWLPSTCLVEDGFLAAVTVTDSFQSSPEMSRVKAESEAWHLFEPPRNLSEFFQHDVRLALGVELNAALFTQLWKTNSFSESQQLMHNFSTGIGIDSAIEEHSTMPQNHALQLKRVLRYSWPEGQNLLKGTLLLPVRVAHMIYMFFVYRLARHYFGKRVFKW